MDGVWTGNVTIGAYADAVVLNAVNPDASGTSNAFAVIRGPMSRLGWANIASPQVLDTPFAVTLRAEDSGGNLVEDFTGSASLAALSQGARPPTGTGALSSYDGLDAFYSQSRFQCIYTPAEVGGAGRLTALDLNLSYPPDIPLENFTIRVKHTSLPNFNSPQAGWETADWTVVYQSSATYWVKGWCNFPFSASFEYDGTSNLMVDFSFNNPNFSFGNGGAYLETTKSDSRKLYYQSIGYPDPLTWSGNSTPSIPSTGLPNLRFTSYNNFSPVRPSSTGSFARGVWSGLVSVPFAAPGVELIADDGGGHTGTSNDFAVKTATPPTGSGTIYSENFETVPLAGSWVFTGTNDYQTQVTTSNTPHSGSRHLTMDSSGYGYSRNEATWTVDLAGISNVTLKFWAKEFSDLPDGPPASPFTDGADFDGVAISADGTKWYEVQSLRSLTSAWTQFTVNLDAAIASLGLTYNPTFKIRFNQYGDDFIPYCGIAVDDIEIVSAPSTYALRVTGPAQVSEGAAAVQFAVTLPFISPADAVVSLTSSAPAKLAVPAQVTVPAGCSIAYFSAQPLEDSLADGRKTVAITASNPVFPTGSLSFLVLDNDQPVATFSAPTTNTVEGAGTLQGTVAIAIPAAAPLVFNVTSTDATAVSVPATVTIPVGATSVALPLSVVNDTKVDGTQSATIAVSLLGSGLSQSLTIIVADNETLDLRLQPTASPAPTTVSEGTGTIAFSANLPGTVTTSTTLTFSSSHRRKSQRPLRPSSPPAAQPHPSRSPSWMT